MELKDFFKENPKLALAYSGGVDSSFLLYAAKQSGADVRAYMALSPFQPVFELEDAKRTAKKLGVALEIIEMDVLKDKRIKENSALRCYYCKRLILESIAERAAQQGYFTIIDGTNASDKSEDRPGMRALEELGILSPLKLCKITKEQVRSGLKEAGFDIWDKPSYSCLATRIKTGESIEPERLQKIDEAEEKIRTLGFKDIRLRTQQGGAKLELQKEDIEKAFQNKKALDNIIVEKFGSYEIGERRT